MHRTLWTFNLHPLESATTKVTTTWTSKLHLHWKVSPHKVQYLSSIIGNAHNIMNLQPEPPNLISTEKFHHIKCNILSSSIGNAQNIMNLQPSPHLKLLPQKLLQHPEPPNSISTEKFHHIKCSILSSCIGNAQNIMNIQPSPNFKVLPQKLKYFGK